jgi:ribonucleoside-diphosphate reductase alpha chain
MRASDFFAMWTSDLFMKRVQENGRVDVNPNECPGLYDVYGEEFEKCTPIMKRRARKKKTIKAQELWEKILESQIETGTPYMLYKDAANRKSNQFRNYSFVKFVY